MCHLWLTWLQSDTVLLTVFVFERFGPSGGVWVLCVKQRQVQLTNPSFDAQHFFYTLANHNHLPSTPIDLIYHREICSVWY